MTGSPVSLMSAGKVDETEGNSHDCANRFRACVFKLIAIRKRHGPFYSSRKALVQAPPRLLDSTQAEMNLSPRAPSSTVGRSRDSGSIESPSIFSQIRSAALE